MPLDDQTKAAFTSTADLAKQLITLGTGILTLEVSFAGGLVKTGMPKLWQVQWSWVFLLLSVVAGAWLLMAITGTLAKTTPPTPQDIFEKNIRVPAAVQILAFLIGVGFTMWYGLAVLGT
jgi:hypothetical protein